MKIYWKLNTQMLIGLRWLGTGVPWTWQNNHCQTGLRSTLLNCKQREVNKCFPDQALIEAIDINLTCKGQLAVTCKPIWSMKPFLTISYYYYLLQPTFNLRANRICRNVWHRRFHPYQNTETGHATSIPVPSNISTRIGLQLFIETSAKQTHDKTETVRSENRAEYTFGKHTEYRRFQLEPDQGNWPFELFPKSFSGCERSN